MSKHLVNFRPYRPGERLAKQRDLLGLDSPETAALPERANPWGAIVSEIDAMQIAATANTCGAIGLALVACMLFFN